MLSQIPGGVGWLMADDGRSGEPQQTPEEVQQARPKFNPLRLIIILLILFAATLIGLHFKSQANPGTESSAFRDQPPQYINVYEANSQIPISVTVTLGEEWDVNYGRFVSPVELRGHGLTELGENVEVTTGPVGSGAPGTIVITSNTPPLPGGGEPISTPVFRLKSSIGPISQALRFAVVVQLFRDQGNTWSGSAFFNSIPIIFQDNGSTFGHLPYVGAYELMRPPVDYLQAQYDRATGRLKDVISLTSGSPQIPAGESGQYLDAPYTISYNEVIDNIVSPLSSEQIDYSIPAINNNNDIDYEWSSNGVAGLQPTFKSTDPDAVDSQNQDAFYSGIAFGVVGAAAIALVQEIPEARKRES
jgi:hypothetical protein